VSASEGPALAGLWLALLVLTARARPYPWRVAVGAVATAAGCVLVDAVLYRHLSHGPTRYWILNGGFIEHHSLGDVASTTNTSTWNLLEGLFGFPAFGPGLRIAIVLAWLALSVLAVARRPSPMLGPALVVVAGFAASATKVAPLGTGRTDEYLYPPLLLLLAAGATEVAALVGLRKRPSPAGARRRWLVRVAAVTVGVAALVGSGTLVVHANREAPAYPGVDVPALASAIRAHEQPGDHVFVSELMRYPWALYEDPHLHLVFGTEWATGFTVISTDPGTFIVPSEDYEGGSDPAAWAADMAPYKRLWYVWFPPLGGHAPSYAALLRQGWHPSGVTLTESDCAATLLVRS
jgi:hypothetical protein